MRLKGNEKERYEPQRCREPAAKGLFALCVLHGHDLHPGAVKLQSTDEQHLHEDTESPSPGNPAVLNRDRGLSAGRVSRPVAFRPTLTDGLAFSGNPRASCKTAPIRGSIPRHKRKFNMLQPKKRVHAEVSKGEKDACKRLLQFKRKNINRIGFVNSKIKYWGGREVLLNEEDARQR